MTFLVSPGVNVTEFDLTTVIPEVAVASGALGGVFQWGPLNERVLVDSEVNLVKRFYKPSNFNAETWFTGADFLGYTNSLYISRAGDATGNTNVVVAGNNTVNALAGGSSTVKFTNTAGLGLHAGQRLFVTNVAAAVFTETNPKILSVTSNTVVLSSAAVSNVTLVEIVFRDDIVYAGVAQETADATIEWAGQLVANTSDYVNKDGLFDDSVLYVARYGGEPGNSLRVSICDTFNQFKSTLVLGDANAQINAVSSVATATVGSPNVVFTVYNADATNVTVFAATVAAWANTLKQSIGNNDLLGIGNTKLGFQYLKVLSVGAVSNTSNVTHFVSSQFTVVTDDPFKLGANVAQTDVDRYWEFYNLVDQPPSISTHQLTFGNTSANDELHVVITDEKGLFTGVPGTVLEVYRSLSRATDAKNEDGRTNYYKDVINQASEYVWWANDRSTALSNTSPFLTSATGTFPLSIQFYGGSNGPSEQDVDVGTLTFAYDQFKSAEDIDVGLIMQGKARGEGVSHFTTLGQYIIQNLCETRKDCVAFLSPDINDVVDNHGSEADDVVDFRNILTSSSYGVLDSGYKYRYDRYNNIYRWTPLNGDIAGLCARTDLTNDPWWSPGGFNRGQIKNVVRLAWNPRQAFRDVLYKSGINPVVTFPGQGTVLFGDKTLLAKPSAFDRINVRRLFITLEKAIATASKFLLFEFNDDFTRATFKNMVVPYLRDVQGRRGIQDFLVVCDGTNNTPIVIDRNEFVGDIYIKPARSINFIQLNFIAVPTGVAFSEVVGKFGQL